MPRAKRLKPTVTSTGATLTYPSIEEINEPPDNFDDYVRIIFGPKGIGKTTAAASFPNSLTLMFEPKRRGLKIRQLPIQKHTAKQIIDGANDPWQLVINTTQQWVEDDTVKCLNFDSVDIFYECCYHSICASHGIEDPSGAGRDSSSIWNEIRDEFSAYFDALRDTDMGINLVSHVKDREEVTLDGSKMGFASPSCSPACLRYIKQAVDIAVFYGWYSGHRAMMVRDEANTSFVATGVEGKFLQPDGKPLSIFQIPDNPSTSIYKVMRDAFDNKLWDMDTLEDDRVVAKPKAKRPPKKP